MTAGDELRQFASDLEKIADEAKPEVRKIFQVGSLKIKNALNANLKASRSFKGAAGSVTYETKHLHRGIESVIGPDKNRRGGALGNIAFFGTSRGGGTVDLEGPFQEESEVIGGLLDDLVGDWADSV